MNKIYKVMYSKVKQCAVVVSEIAKSHGHNGESSGVRKHAALTAAVLIALGSLSFTTAFVPMTAEAATTRTAGSNFVGVERTDDLPDENDYDNYGGKGANGADSITLGLRAKAGEGTITIGDRNAGASLGSVYVGQGDIANPKLDKGGWATSIGYNSDATGYGSIALGSNAVAENSYALDSKGNSLKLNDDTKFRLNPKPDIQRASVAIGYGARADNGNIAIGSYSDASTDLRTAKTTDGKEIKSYLTDKMADSYVSVGDGKDHSETQYRRISNVADGASASDVATVGQLQALAAKSGTYKAGFGIEITPDTTTKENTIKLSRNLGRDMDSTDKATLVADESKSALVLGGRVEEGQSKKGQIVEKPYGAFGQDSVVVGGANNIADKDGVAAVVIGGTTNTASAQYSTVAGGNNNDAFGNESSVFGGFDNDAFGAHATLSGGSMNRAYGAAASVFGGGVNSALGDSSVAVGGLQSTVNGTFAVGIAGGSTNADYALAAGNGANVTVENGTAIGYQATTDEAGTIAFGHDAGDAYYSSTTWPQKATKQNGKYYDANNKEISKAKYDALKNSDGTWNDYSKTPTVVEKTYDKAAYNRLVKVADGVDPHDVVVMEQLSKAQNDLKVNAGWGINIEDVTTKDENGKEMTKKNVISLKRNLGKNYGSRYGTGKVNFEADGENSLILGGGALNDSWEDRDKEVTYGAHGKDSILVGGLNNDIAKDSEKVATSIGTKASIGTRAVIIGGTSNTVSYDPVTEKDPDTGKEKVKVDSNGNVIVQTQKTGTDAIIVGGLQNTAKGDGSVLIGGESNEATGFYSTVIGGTSNKTDGWLSSIFGGTKNTITGAPTAAGIFGGTGNTINSNGIAANVFGGENNTADNTLAVVVGGETNTSSGLASIILGGNHNTANQLLATVVGGQLNTATGETSMISGGIGNVTSGAYSYDAGGLYNRVTGMAASSLGGLNSSVNGMFSTGVAGGSTGENTILSLAAGYQSVVTDSGVEKTYVTGDDAEKVLEDQYSGKELPGYYTRDQSVDYGPGEPGRLIHYDKFATALGYQATADEYGTIAFGHDAGDESGYTYEWEQLPAGKYAVDGTTNDYSKAPKSVKKKAPYTSSYYNRLVKVADGIDDHDVVVMEQLNKSKTHFYSVNSKDTTAGNYNNDGATGKNALAAGVGAAAKGDNSVAIGTSTSTGTQAIAIGEKAKAGNQGIAVGANAFAVSSDNMALGNYASVESGVNKSTAIGYGSKVTKRDILPTDNGTYGSDGVVSVGRSVGQSGEPGITRRIINVRAGVNDTDAVNVSQLKEVQDGLTHFYSVKSDGVTTGNYNNDGAKGTNSLAAGVSAVANGGESVAVGSHATAGSNAMAIGSYAKAENNSTAIGTHASTTSSQNLAIGYYANVTGRPDKIKNSVALGASSTVGEKDILDTDNGYGVLSIGAKDKERRIIHVRAGVNDTDAVNVSQLESVQSDLTGKGLKFAANSGNEYTAKLGSTVTIQGTKKTEGHEYTADNLTTEIDEKGNITILMDKDMSVEKLAVNGKNGKDGAPGTPGSIGISGQDGQSSVGIDGKDGISIKGNDGKDGVTIKVDNGKDGKDGSEGHIGLTGRDGSSADIIVKKGYDDKDKGINGANGVDGKNGITRIVYTDAAGDHQVATMEDGLKFKGDDTTVINKKLNNTLDIIGGAKGDLTEGNIGVNSDGDKLKVQLSKDLTGMNSTTYTTTTGEGESATTSTTVVNGNGLTITDGPSITNKGIDGGNKVITNVGSGIETDANGKYTVTDQNKGNAANIGDVQNMVNEAVNSAADTTNKALAGKANVDASNIGANLKGEDGKTPATEEEMTKNENAWGSAIGTGKIEANNGQLVTGKTVYEYNKPVAEDGKTLNYISEGKTTGQNLGALDAHVKANADKIAQNTKDISEIKTNVRDLTDNAVQYDNDSKKSKITLAGEKGTTITNVKDGSVGKDSKDAVNGGQLFDEKMARENADTKIKADITKIKDGEGFTEKGQTVIKSLAQDAVDVKGSDYVTVTNETKDGTKTFTVSVDGNGKVASGDKGLISGDTIYNELRPATDGTYIKTTNTTAQNLTSLDTQVKKTSDLINSDGKTIKIGGSDAATKIDVNGNDGKGRVITGVVSDANDPTSAANVGYVNGVTAANTQQIYRDMNNAYGRLNNNINKAAAGSNALAALHPLDYDPDDKADFAVGYGHYRNANAAAVGAFYHPNENTMVNVGVSLGNGDPGFNAGVSFKVGRGGAGREAMSKTEMAKVINSQSKEIDALKKDNADKDKRIDALEQKMAEILAKLDKNGK